ncbi:RtcB family protein [Sedimentibacter sp. zth1]|uniref:RtcB family protein n=1 Tax=Sedimentibacter sp. zth1 TaxID=2816908 RepID=UPI001A92136C|nr:RtcB family protein [Sedimentibacter sp. zth1]QSX05001.1 RtcB family protein [Sedimentibacter sp. zth1]
MLNNYIKNVDNSYIDSRLIYLNNQQDIKKIILNCDLEPDYESLTLTGTMICSDTFVYPFAAGFDLGCGLGLFLTDLNKNDIKQLKLEETSPFGIRKSKYTNHSNSNNQTVIGKSIMNEYLGQVETGNHFVEIRLLNNKICILVHSGLPKRIKNLFAMELIDLVKKYNPNIMQSENSYEFKLNKNSFEAINLIKAIEEANNFTRINRQYIAKKIVKSMNGKIIDYIDASHEYIKFNNENIIHCHGTQEYVKKLNNYIAVVLSGSSSPNYVVKKNNDIEYINHGTILKSINCNGERNYSSFEELSDDNATNFRSLYKLIPLYCCKRRAKKYVYEVY